MFPDSGWRSRVSLATPDGAMPWRFLSWLIVSSLILAGSCKSAEPTSAPVGSNEWVVRAWQTENGLPQNTVNAILQTRDGFLWLGTSGGLARFDGVRFLKFGLQDGLRSVRISTLAQDKQGALWVGTTGAGVSRYEHGRFTSFDSAEGFPGGFDVVSMAAGRDGCVWIGTTKGLVKAHDGKFSLIGEESGLPLKQIGAIAEDPQGVLWVSVLEGGLFRGTNGHFTPLGEMAPMAVYSLTIDHAGGVWAGAGNGLLWHWHDGAWERFEKRHGLPLASFVALAEGADGTLWVGAQTAGLYRSEGDRFVPASHEGELSDQAVRRLAIDQDGSIWIGTVAGGINRLSPRLIRFWDTKIGPSRVGVTSVAADENGVPWVSFGSRGLFRFEDGTFKKVEDPAISRLAHHIYATTSASDGSIWAAGESCLYRFKAGEPTKSFLEAPVAGEAIRALCADGDTVWLGTYYSTLLKCDGQAVQVVAPAGSFRGDVTSILKDETDGLWVGSSGGLHYWQRGKIVRSWDTRDGLLTPNVRTLFRDSDGALWIGTHGGGLARLKDGRIFNITTRHGLIDDVISQIVADDYGFLDLGCNRGIMRIPRSALHALADGKISEVHPIVFGKNEGMHAEQCAGGVFPTAIKMRDGRLLFPTASGVAEIDPRRLDGVKDSAPRVVIDSVSADGRVLDSAAPVVVPPGRHRLEVSYSAPALRSGAWLRFRHQLSGVDQDWVVSSGDKRATYEALKPGNYVFRVMASGGREWNNSGATLNVTVEPFIWQTLWGQILAACVVVGMNGSAVWWYSRRRHARHLAEIERTRKHQAELARVGRVSLLGELSASLAHELNQPLAAILSNAQAAVRFLEHEEIPLQELRDILKDIATDDRRASEIIGRMRALMKKGEAQMEPRDLNADIEQVLGLMHSDLVARKVDVIRMLAPDLPPIRGDHIQLQQVLLNLVVNGCDAMRGIPSGERLVIIETARAEEGSVQVSVSDRGSGIAPELLEQIFEPFFSTKETGLGMGLAICQAIIKGHGGQLWATNNIGRGATFHFTLKAGV